MFNAELSPEKRYWQEPKCVCVALGTGGDGVGRGGGEITIPNATISPVE